MTPVGWNDKTSHFIDRLQYDDKIPKIDTEILMEDFIAGIKRWKERTTTSHSGRHLRHLHVLIAPDEVLDPEEDGDPTKELAEKILRVHLRMMNMAVLWATLYFAGRMSQCLCSKKKKANQKSINSGTFIYINPTIILSLSFYGQKMFSLARGTSSSTP